MVLQAKTTKKIVLRLVCNTCKTAHMHAIKVCSLWHSPALATTFDLLTFSSQVTGRVADLPWLICLVTLNSCDSVYDFLLGPVQCHSMSLFLKGSFQCAQFCCFSDCLSTFPVRLRPHSMPAKQRERVVEWLTVWCLICSDASTSRLVVTRSRRARLTRLSVLWHDVL